MKIVSWREKRFWGIFGVLKVWSRVLSSLQLWAQTGWHQWNEGRQSRREELLLKNSRGLFSGWPLTQSSVIGKAPNRRIWITWHYFVHGLGWSFLVEQATASWRPCTRVVLSLFFFFKINIFSPDIVHIQ